MASSMRQAHNDACNFAFHEHQSFFDDPPDDDFGLGLNGVRDGNQARKIKQEKHDLAPAWSELKTKAGKERKRLPLACIACRRKKIRCSGEKPACRNCHRGGTPCVYKNTARETAPRTDYMALLDRRLKRMEERMIRVVPRILQEASISPSIPRAVLRPSLPTSLPSSKASAKKRRADEAFGLELDHWAHKVAASLSGKSHLVAQPANLRQADEQQLMQEGLEALPSKEIQVLLAETYFEYLYGQGYSIFHKPTFMRQLRSDALPPVVILSVCAISARFATHAQINSSPAYARGEEWASVARSIVLKRYDRPDITTLTCVLILGLHEFGTCHGGRSWAFTGHAIRIATFLRLHLDLDHDPRQPSKKFTVIEREIRRRLMWACFIIDRITASGTDRLMVIQENSIKIPLPTAEKQFLLGVPGVTQDLRGDFPSTASAAERASCVAGETMGVGAYIIKAIAIWGRVLAYLDHRGRDSDDFPIWAPESGYADLLKQTEDLNASIPDWLAYNGENLRVHNTLGLASQFLVLHVFLQHSILFLSRFVIATPGSGSRQELPKSFLTAAGARAFGAANRISEVLRDAETYFVAAPFVGYCAFVAGTVHIFGIFSGNPAIQSTAKQNFATIIKYLAKTNRYWGMFHFMSESLREQYQACAEAIRKGTSAIDAASITIFQYADWFDRFPNGLVQPEPTNSSSVKQPEKVEELVARPKLETHRSDETVAIASPMSQDSISGISRSSNKKPATSKRTAAPAGRKHSGSKETSSVKPRSDQMQPIQIPHHMHGMPVNTPTSTYNPLAGQHEAHGPSVFQHSMSPISPASHFPRQGPHEPASHYAPDQMLSMQLAQHGQVGSINRQLDYLSYGNIHPANNMSMSMSQPGSWNDHTDPGRMQYGGPVSEGQGRHHSIDSRHHSISSKHDHLGLVPDSQQHSGVAQEPNAAWYMPYNMEAHDMQNMGGSAMANMDNMHGYGAMYPTDSSATGLGPPHTSRM